MLTSYTFNILFKNGFVKDMKKGLSIEIIATDPPNLFINSERY